MKTRTAFLAGFVLTLAPSTCAAQTATVQGQVIDKDGKPVPGIEVATYWTAHDGVMLPDPAVTTDGSGRFTVKAAFGGWPVPVIAMDRARRMGGMAAAADAAAAKGVTITLGPLVHVHGSFLCKELGRRPNRTIVTVRQVPNLGRLLDCRSDAAAFSFYLPAGDYKFWAFGTDAKGLHKDITLSPDKPDFNMGILDMPATMIASHVGKKLPAWTVTDARGVKKDVRLEDFKGKWVLLEFWGFW